MSLSEESEEKLYVRLSALTLYICNINEYFAFVCVISQSWYLNCDMFFEDYVNNTSVDC